MVLLLPITLQDNIQYHQEVMQKADEVFHQGHITGHHQAAFLQVREVPTHQDLRQDHHLQDLHPHLILHQEGDNIEYLDFSG